MTSSYTTLFESSRPFQPVVIGEDESGQKIELTEKDFYHHLHILGLSGRGKSRAIEYILRQFLLNRTGFTLLDPHGDIYDALVEWIAWMEELFPGFLEERTIHLFDPADPEFSPGYNPLRVRDGEYAEDRVAWFLEAMAQALGGEKPHVMQWYHLVFTAVMHALTEKGLTPTEALLVMPESERVLHQWLSRDVTNRAHAAAWKKIRGWSNQEYEQKTSSFFSRIHDVFQGPALQRIFGQTENLFDPLEAMDGGHTVLVNLKDRTGFTDEASKLLGRLLVNAYQQAARKFRPANAARPHILVIDECHDYLSGDIPRILDGTRKFGLHLVLSHQRIEQLYEAGPNVAGAIMAGAQTKLVFGSTYQTGLAIADELFGSTYDLERVKENVKRPVTSGHRVRRLEGGAEAIADSHGYGEVTGEGGASGRSVSDTAGTSRGRSYDYDSYFDALPSSRGYNSAASDSRSVAESQVTTRHHAVSTQQSTTATSTQNWREVLVPIIEWHPADTYTIDELRHEAAVLVKDLDQQRAILERAIGREVVVVTTVSFDRPVVDADLVRQFVRWQKSTSGINTPGPVVDQRIATRELAVRRAAGPIILPPERPEAPAFGTPGTEDVAAAPASARGSRRWLTT